MANLPLCRRKPEMPDCWSDGVDNDWQILLVNVCWMPRADDYLPNR